MIWMTRGEARAISLFCTAFTLASARQINWLFISDIGLAKPARDWAGERECAWSKSRIYDSRNVHTTRAEEEIAETFELGKEKQPNRFKSAFLVLCFSNIYQMSTKKIFGRRASTRKKLNRLAANNYVKKGRELHLNLTLNVKVTAKRPKKPAVIYSNRCRRRARRSEESAGH